MRADSSAATILAITVLFAGCNAAPASREAPGASAAGESSRASAVQAAEWFTDRAKELGLDFVHVNGSSGQLYIPEILAPGAAMFDYDGDGDLDVLEQSLRQRRHGMFEDRSAPSGVGPMSLGYTGFGTPWIDYDNDG
jgi:hypothetical protein